MSVAPGDWVRTRRHRHHGKVLMVYPDCPENSLWQATQTLSEQEMAGEWALVWTAAANTVVVPVSDCEPAEALEVDDLPDRIVVEMFGATEEEAAAIGDSLQGLPGEGEVHRKVLAFGSVPPQELLPGGLVQMTELLAELSKSEQEGEADG